MPPPECLYPNYNGSPGKCEWLERATCGTSLAFWRVALYAVGRSQCLKKVKRLAFDWRRLNFERPSPEYVQQQIRILGWILETARECLTLAPECYLLAQILAFIPARSWKQAVRCGRLFLFTNGQHAML